MLRLHRFAQSRFEQNSGEGRLFMQATDASFEKYNHETTLKSSVLHSPALGYILHPRPRLRISKRTILLNTDIL